MLQSYLQKRVSGFKTHKTSPAVKGIHVWIVLFVLMTFMNVHYNVLHVELSWGVPREQHYYEAKLI